MDQVYPILATAQQKERRKIFPYIERVIPPKKWPISGEIASEIVTGVCPHFFKTIYWRIG